MIAGMNLARNDPSGDFPSADFLTITCAKNDERQFRLGLRLAF
jgi:hypothetical protein